MNSGPLESNAASANESGQTSGAKSLLGLVGWLVLCFGAAALGSLFRPDAWYAALRKPAWNPPGWIFGPVWTLLYCFMAIAAWLIWRRGGFSQQSRPLTFFLLQLALNAAWSPLFFGVHSLALSSLEIIVLWMSIAVTLTSFRPVSRTAAALMLPYLLWVSFATALNITIWLLNSRSA